MWLTWSLFKCTVKSLNRLSSKLIINFRFQLMNTRACITECIFHEEDLLDDVKEIDREAFSKLFISYDDALKPAIHATMEKCFGSYDAELDSSLECKSGAFELTNCLTREGFLNCHNKSYWTPSPACEELKVNVTKCPKIPVILGATREMVFQ